MVVTFCAFQATYDPSHGYSPQPIEISHMALSRDLQVWPLVFPHAYGVS